MKIKEVAVFIASLACTIIVCLIIKNAFFTSTRPITTYDLTTCFFVKCKGRVLNDRTAYDVSKLVNDKNELLCTLCIENYSNRQVDFEFYLLKNYITKSISVNQEEQDSYNFQMSGNGKLEIPFVVSLDNKESARLIFCLRQDTQNYIAYNSAIDGSTTVSTVIDVKGKKSLKGIVVPNVSLSPGSNFGARKLEMIPLNGAENTKIVVKSKETISVRLRLSSYVKNSKVILWGTANAQQLRISKSKKMVAAIRDRNSEIGVEFNAPKDKGLYEVEFFCEEYSAQKIMPIYSSNRLTIKVE